MSEIRVNNIIDEAGTGAPTFPNGATGNLTGNVTGTATTATGLSGTPNITVGTITGTDATFSGNLTVNGTTTTIDTAVTDVDSLAVDGTVSVGVTNASDYGGAVKVAVANTTGSTGLSIVSSSSGDGNLYFADGTTGDSTYRGYVRYNHTLDQFRIGTSGIERLRIDGNGTTKFKGPLTEKAHYDTGGGLTGDYNHNMLTYGNVYWSDTAAAGAFTFNLRGSSTVALNDMMDTGESFSFWFAHACNSNTAYYMTAFKVDGTTISGGNIIWSGGSAPTSAGGGSGTKDVYTFTVFKAGNAFFRAFAAQTNHT